ncbi:MAG: penicillin acylase family protein [Ginsengibacter sp.]
MMKNISILIFLLFFSPATNFAQSNATSSSQVTQWETQAKNVSIIRDNYGIPHVYGKSDADAVFGLMYAQCEDDFNRVELNYIEKLGRLGEVKGEKELYNDLLIRLVIDSTDAIKDYNTAPEWLKKLCNAFADGINYFLYKNPQIKPALLTHFQPWYPMLWTDGSIGAISTSDVTIGELRNFYSGKNDPVAIKEKEEEVLTGSNGFAFSPKITQSKNAILYINPHVTFYFRPEVHMGSEEGLNAYGAVTWGQFFVYQGFNEHCGWMHTSSQTDISDSYIEKIISKNGKLYFEYNGKEIPVITKEISLNYENDGTPKTKIFQALFTGHGPIMANRNGQYISVKSNNRDIKGLIQSWQRTKAKSFAEYKKIMDLLANTSNNTVYADAEGNIAYWQGNFIPKRDPSYDWSKPVDGTTSATDWKGLHPVNESVHIYNPANGWIQNCNSTPFTVSGPLSPKRENYPTYMAPDGENFRGLNAVRILGTEKEYTIDKVIAKGYNTYLAAFEVLIPSLVKAYDNDVKNKAYLSLKEPMNILRNWNFESGKNSVATTLAVLWGEKIQRNIYQTPLPPNELNDQVNKTSEFAKKASASQLLDPLLLVIHDLETNIGKWEIKWGNINRFQRISGDIDQHYNDDSISIPVGFASSAWGQLPSYSSKVFPGTKKRYGINGNSFICAVEFIKKDASGKTRIKAKSLLAGGESGHKESGHFFDQGEMYSEGKFKDVLFYKEDVLRHVEKRYHPGK